MGYSRRRGCRQGKICNNLYVSAIVEQPRSELNNENSGLSAILEQPRSELDNENSRFSIELTVGLGKYF